MGQFRVTGPDGTTYNVTAPEGTTEADVIARVRAQAQPKKPPSLGSQIMSGAKNAVAAVAQGAASLPDTVVRGVSGLMGLEDQLTSGIGERVMRGVGASGIADLIKRGVEGRTQGYLNPATIGGAVESVAPSPQNGPGRTARTVGQGLGAVMSGVGTGRALVGAGNAVARGVGRTLTAKPVSQAVAATTGGLASDAVRARGGSPLAQTAANVGGGLVGGGIASGVGRAVQATRTPSNPPQIVRDAQAANVPIMTSDVSPPRTFVGKMAQATGERIPYAGTGSVRQNQQQSRIAAVRSVLSDYGADSAAQASDDVMKDLATKRGADLTKLTQVKSGVINKLQGQVPVGRTTQAIDNEIARLRTLKTAEVQPVIAKLEDWKQAVQGQNLPNVELLRGQWGKAFKAPELASIRDLGEKSLSNIYGPLRDDMGAFIKSTGGPQDFARWKNANDQLSGMAKELKVGTLKSALAKGDATPEVVNGMLFSSKPSDVRLLYNNLSTTGRARARTAILQRAAEKAGGFENISPDKFANEVTRLGKSVGVFFSGEDTQRIEGLSRVLAATKRAGQAGVSPPTGVQNFLPVGAAALTDILGGFGAAMTAGGSIGLLARLYESAATRNLLLSLSRVPKGSPKEAILISKFMSDPSVRKSLEAINDNVGVRAAASNTEENKSEKQ